VLSFSEPTNKVRLSCDNGNGEPDGNPAVRIYYPRLDVLEVAPAG
jgi:hypothetical protein